MKVSCPVGGGGKVGTKLISQPMLDTFKTSDDNNNKNL